MTDRPPTVPDAAREAVLHQLGHLVDEVEAVRPRIGPVSDALLEGRPRPQDRSIKEIFGLMAALDARVYGPALARLGDDEPVPPSGEEAALPDEPGWNDRDIDALLATVVEARRRLVATAEALPPEAWTRTVTAASVQGKDLPKQDAEVLSVLELLRRLCRQDAQRLRTVGYRLYESNYAPERPSGLPE